MERKNGTVHARIHELTSVPTSAIETGYLVIRTEEVDKFYQSVEEEVASLYPLRPGEVVLVYMPPRVSERLAEKNFPVLRTDKKKARRPDVQVGQGHSVILIRRYTLREN